MCYGRFISTYFYIFEQLLMKKVYLSFIAAMFSASVAVAQDGTDIWESIDDWSVYCPHDEMGDIVNHTLVDIDGDGVKECFVEGDYTYGLLTCGNASGQPDAGSIRLAVNSIPTTSLYCVEGHPFVLHQGGCGTGCVINEYVKIINSSHKATYQNISYYTAMNDGKEPSEEEISFCKPGSEPKTISSKAYYAAIPQGGNVQLIQMEALDWNHGDCNCGEGDDCQEEYQNSAPLEYDRLNQMFSSETAPNIRKFASLLELTFENEEQCDLKNGYFETSYEGDGAGEWRGALWKRNDGSRLYIVSYLKNDFVHYDPNSELEFGSVSARLFSMAYNVCYTETFKPVNLEEVKVESQFATTETGFVAFLYNPQTHQLEPIQQLSKLFNNMPNNNVHRFLEVPRNGKDIKVREGMYNFDNKYTYHTLKWNGMTFDYVK